MFTVLSKYAQFDMCSLQARLRQSRALLRHTPTRSQSQHHLAWQASRVSQHAHERAAPLNCQWIFDAFKADTWSIGISLVVSVTGFFPWKVAELGDRRYAAWYTSFEHAHTPTAALWAKIFGGRTCTQHGTTLSDAFMHFVRGLLHPEPHRRMSAQQALQHPWMQL